MNFICPLRVIEQLCFDSIHLVVLATWIRLNLNYIHFVVVVVVVKFHHFLACANEFTLHKMLPSTIPISTIVQLSVIYSSFALGTKLNWNRIKKVNLYTEKKCLNFFAHSMKEPQMCFPTYRTEKKNSFRIFGIFSLALFGFCSRKMRNLLMKLHFNLE